DGAGVHGEALVEALGVFRAAGAAGAQVREGVFRLGEVAGDRLPVRVAGGVLDGAGGGEELGGGGEVGGDGGHVARGVLEVEGRFGAGVVGDVEGRQMAGGLEGRRAGGGGRRGGGGRGLDRLGDEHRRRLGAGGRGLILRAAGE